MPDLWTRFNELDRSTQERLSNVLETRGSDPRQQALRSAFLAGVDFVAGARVLEVGCGTGVLTRRLARMAGVGSVVGVDQGHVLLEKARSLSVDLPNVTFQEANGESLPFDDGTFDLVVFDSVLSHMSDPGRAVTEAFRVLRPLGRVAAFDGDYATTTVALGDHDPLQACVDAMMERSVHDRWLARRLPSLFRERGFEVTEFRSHGMVVFDGEYMLTIVERGADALCGEGIVGTGLAAAMKAEARRRVEARTFFGHIAYASITALRPSACG